MLWQMPVTVIVTVIIYITGTIIASAILIAKDIRRERKNRE